MGLEPEKSYSIGMGMDFKGFLSYLFINFEGVHLQQFGSHTVDVCDVLKSTTNASHLQKIPHSRMVSVVESQWLLNGFLGG